MIRLKHFALAAAVVAIACTAGFAFRGENNAKLIEQFKKDREALFANGSAKSEDYNKLINDFFSKVEFDTASLEDLIAIQGLGLLRAKEHHAKAVARLSAFDGKNGVLGAQSAALRLALEGGYGPAGQAPEEKQVELLDKLLAQPSLTELLRSKEGKIAMDAIGGIGRKTVYEKRGERLIGILLSLTPEHPSDVITSAGGSWGVINAGSAGKPELKEKARTHLAGVFSKALATRGEEFGKAKSYLERQVKFLNGAFARGMLLNHSAPNLSIQWSSDPNVKSLADLKGKVVILDFWATWCGPCVASFPNVKELVDLYKDKPVAIVGVTSIQGTHYDDSGAIDCKGDPKKEMGLMPEYMKKKGMNWTVVFAEEDVFNPDFGVVGIPHVAIIDANGKVRHNGLHPAAPKEQKTKLIDELLAEIGK